MIIDAKNTVINATSDNAESSGIVALSQGVLRANGDYGYFPPEKHHRKVGH